MTEHNRKESSTLSTGNARCKLSSIVVFDTEASCLPSPGKTPKITELCLLSVLTDELQTQERLPRVINKLQLCFNPKKPIDPSASRITGMIFLTTAIYTAIYTVANDDKNDPISNVCGFYRIVLYDFNHLPSGIVCRKELT